MKGEQARIYQPVVDEWKRRIAEVPGWEEEQSELPVPDAVRLWAYMENYRWNRVLSLHGRAVANGDVTIGVHAYQAKSHMNRLIACVEDLPDTVSDAYQAVHDATLRLQESHPARGHQVKLSAAYGLPMEAYATSVRQTQEVNLVLKATRVESSRWLSFSIRVPYHTVCPFMLFECGGPSHTQRTYVTVAVQVPMLLEEEPADLLHFPAIIDEMNVRLTPTQSRMKIPDEAINVLRAYSTPTYTEFGALQILSVVRDKKSAWLRGPDREVPVHIHVQSIESISCNDIVSTLDTTV